jgi:hypothetical protein
VPARQPAGGPPGPAKPGPGQFEVDEEDIDRALERALVEAGALLLPPGMGEITPGFSYTRRERGLPGDIVLLEDQPGLVGSEDLFRRDTLEADLTLRLGLPWTSQIELGIPYGYEETSTVGRVNGAAFQEESNDASGLGDIRVRLTKELLREGEYWPSLLAGIEWDSSTGKTENGITTGSGFDEIRVSLTGAKRQDPLVFTAGVSYERSFEHNDIKPGDEIGLSLGTLLAVTPGTSLGFSFDQSFSDEAEFKGQRIEGSDQVAGQVSFRLSSIVAPKILLDLSIGVGVTDDAPDYTVRIAFPIRFSLPFQL